MLFTNIIAWYNYLCLQILSLIYGINYKKHAVIENSTSCFLQLTINVKKVIKEAIAFPKRACVVCAGELNTCTQLSQDVVEFSV